MQFIHKTIQLVMQWEKDEITKSDEFIFDWMRVQQGKKCPVYSK